MLVEKQLLQNHSDTPRSSSSEVTKFDAQQNLLWSGLTSSSTNVSPSRWFQPLDPVVGQDSEISLRKLRIALYSHDTMGLGHKRHNLLIAQTLACSPLQTDILLITGMREGSDVPTPDGVDYVALPALHKGKDGQYQSRRLNLSLREIITLRANIIRATVESFRPDVLIVDNVPRGAVRELDLTLEYLYAQGHTRCILGLRDVLDDPITIQREWKHAANEDIIRKYYDKVWVYGDPDVYDLVQEYNLSPDVAAKVCFTGCFDQCKRMEFASTQNPDPITGLGLPPGRLALCLVGGGQDGAKLAETFAQANLPRETNGVIVTEPFMPQKSQERLHRIAAEHPRLRVLEFISEPTQLLSRADCVIAMGGYNTTYEILSFEKPALIVPRVKPRREQLIRAERLQELGLVDVLHPNEVNLYAVTEWISKSIGANPRSREYIDFKGLERLPQLLAAAVATPVSSARKAS